MIDYIKQNRKVLLLILGFILLIILVTLFLLTTKLRSPDSSEEPLSYTTSSANNDTPISFPNTLSRFATSKYLTPSINKAYVLTEVNECLNEIINPNFPDLRLEYDSCQWSIKIGDKEAIQKSVMGVLYETYIKFTNNKTSQYILISLVAPIASGYEGPTVCLSDQSKVFKINSNLYRYKSEVNYVNEGIKEVILYKTINTMYFKGNNRFNEFLDFFMENISLSYPKTNKEDYFVCIPTGPDLIVRTSFTGESRDIALRIENYNTNLKSWSWGSIYLSSKDNDFREKVEDLLKDFNF